jgi:hypothetical protein
MDPPTLPAAGAGTCDTPVVSVSSVAEAVSCSSSSDASVAGQVTEAAPVPPQDGTCTLPEKGTQVADPPALATTQAAAVCADEAGQQVLVVHRTLMVFKPRCVLSSVHDPQGRSTLAHVLDAAGAPPLRGHVGRLDFETSGLILVTTDGRLNNKLRHPVSVVTATLLTTSVRVIWCFPWYYHDRVRTRVLFVHSCART